MLGQPADTNDRKRTAGASSRAPSKSLATSRRLRQIGAGEQQQQQHPHKATAGQGFAEGSLQLTRPQTETTRSHYETLIWRGISLLQPHSVLFIAEAYHSWYHSPATDVSSSVLQQTLGKHVQAAHASQKSSSEDEYDIRSVYWLALCHWHLGEVTSVYALLSPIAVEVEYIIDHCDSDSESVPISTTTTITTAAATAAAALSESPKLRSKKALACGLWLLAMSCTRLEKWQEAEDNLEALAGVLALIYPPDDPGPTTGADIRLAMNSGVSLYTLPALADISDLLGLVCIRTNRIAQSESHSLDALRRNPVLWSSCRRLCELGSLEKLATALSVNLDHIAPRAQPQPQKQQHQQQQENLAETTPVSLPRPTQKHHSVAASTIHHPPTSAAARKAGMATRQAASQQHRQPSVSGLAGTGEPATSIRLRTRLASQLSAAGGSISRAKSTLSAHVSTSSSSSASRGSSEQRPEAAARSISHLPTKTPGRSRVAAPATSEKKRARNGAAVRSVSLSSSLRDYPTPSAMNPLETKPTSLVDRRAFLHIHQLVQLSGMAHVHALSYRAVQALLAFSALPVEQRNSAWGLCLLGRICFEAGRYPEAARAFESGHRLAPYRVRDMDIYSTLLWHMKREERLAQLAHAMISVGRNWSPEAWLTVANCFSLDGDHAAALKSLARSIQLYKSSHGGITVVPRGDSGAISGLAYAHTLAGHENVASDELDRAQQSFRTAIRINPRHYNAWYGMGMVYLRLGKLDLAEYHFKRALALNPQNPLLLQSAGAVYESRKDYLMALKVYERVERLLADGYAVSADKGKAAESAGMSAHEEEDSDGAVVLTGEQIVLSLGSHHALNFVVFKRARVLVVLGRFAEAASALELLLRRCPREFNVPFLLGQTYTKLRRYREAAACLTRALDIAPENGQSVREAFDALYQQDADDREAADADSENRESTHHGDEPASFDQTPPSGYHNTSSGDILSSSPPVESPYFESPSLYAGTRGQMEWRRDWQALGSADDRVDRALEFDAP